MSARLFKRGNIWFAWIPKRGGGTRKVTTQCTNKDAAAKRASEFEQEAIDPDYAAANKTSTAAACAEFIGSRKRRGRAAGTLHHYGVKLGHVLRLMPARLGDIDAAACERFIETRLGEGAAQTTVKKEIRALGATLRHARRSGTYLRVVETVIPELEETYKPRERSLAPLEFVALCSALGPARAAHAIFIVATGARWGESVRARPGDVNGSMVRLRGTKTKKAPRTVPVPPTMRIALQCALDWSSAHSQRLGDGPMFLPWGNVRRDLGVACKKLGIAPVTPNDLRRTFATWLAETGLATSLIGSALGHTTSRMADRVYGRISADALDRLITERGPAMTFEKKSPAPGLLMGGDVAEPSHLESPPETPAIAKAPENQCPGTESNRRHGDFQSLENGSNDGLCGSLRPEWAANGSTFRARARRWLMREAA